MVKEPIAVQILKICEFYLKIRKNHENKKIYIKDTLNYLNDFLLYSIFNLSITYDC